MGNRSVKYTYVTLWTAFLHLKLMYDEACADQQTKDDALALRLAALNMAFYSLEAFLNHLIQAIKPEVWTNERMYFSGRKQIDGNKYYGPIGKLKFVHVLCGRKYDENSDSIKTVIEIKRLRDMMAHGRSYYDKPDDIKINDIHIASGPTSELFSIATHELLLAVFRHFDSLRCSLFDETKQCFEDIDLGFHPSVSTAGMQSISVVP